MAALKCCRAFGYNFNFNNNVRSILKLNYATKIDNSSELLVDRLSGDQEGISVFSLNRQKVKNALGKTIVNDLLKEIDLIKQTPTRVLIMRSTVPGVFCAGADLKERAKMSSEEVAKFVNSLRQMMKNIENLPFPVIAALDGVALGGGLEMALACDIRIASSNIKMGLVETRLAIIPGAGGTQKLPRIINPSLAKELIFTARVFDGLEAKEMGIVNHTVDQNENNDAAYKKALQLAEEMLPNGPIALKMAKRAIDDGIQVPLSQGYKVEETCYQGVINTKDRLEGLQAFKEKRKPVYTGN